MDYIGFLRENGIASVELFIEYHSKKRYNHMFARRILNCMTVHYDGSLFESDEQFVEFLIKGDELLHCEMCGKTLPFSKKRPFCDECKVAYRQKHKEESNARRKQTCLARYGAEYATMSKQVQDKTKATCMTKYGSECSLQNEEVAKKTKVTNLKRYGYENSNASEIVKEKMKQTFRRKYGKDYASQTEEVKDKIKKTFESKYGVDNPLKVSSIKAKQRGTMIKRHGVEVKRDDERYKEVCLDKYGFTNPKLAEAWSNICKLKDYEPMFSKDEFKGNKRLYEWKCKHCGTIFNAVYDAGHVRSGCQRCTHASSKYEREIAEFLSECGLTFKKHDRTLLYPEEIDFVIEDLKLCIEFNGDYWHSIDRKPMNFHLDKVIKCNEKGYRLIHIWEDEWISSKGTIEDKLTSIFNGTELVDFIKPLDRSWYNNLSSDGYALKEATALN